MYHLRVIPVAPMRYLQKKLLARGWYSVGAARTIFGKQQTDDINIDWSHKNHYIKYYSTAPSTISMYLYLGILLQRDTLVQMIATSQQCWSI